MSETTVTPAPATTTPPAAPPAPSAPPADSVTLSKAEVEQLRRDAARAAEAQARADRLEKAQKRSKTHFSSAQKPTPPSEDELEAAARAEDRKAERGLMKLAADPQFRDVLDSDPTLRDLLISNPLAVLPTYAPDALDADDAVDMVKDMLAGRKAKATPPPAPPAPPAPPTPPAGGVNPPGTSAEPDAEYEAARKNPNTESAIAGMFMAKAKGMKK